MEKILFNTKKEFDCFFNTHTGIVAGHGRVNGNWLGEPEKYPCVLVWVINYDGDGPDTLEGEFVYTDDFEA